MTTPLCSKPAIEIFKLLSSTGQSLSFSAITESHRQWTFGVKTRYAKAKYDTVRNYFKLPSFLVQIIYLPFDSLREAESF